MPSARLRCRLVANYAISKPRQVSPHLAKQPLPVPLASSGAGAMHLGTEHPGTHRDTNRFSTFETTAYISWDPACATLLHTRAVNPNPAEAAPEGGSQATPMSALQPPSPAENTLSASFRRQKLQVNPTSCKNVPQFYLTTLWAIRN